MRCTLVSLLLAATNTSSLWQTLLFFFDYQARGRLFRNCVKQEVRRMMEEDASAKGNKDEI